MVRIQGAWVHQSIRRHHVPLQCVLELVFEEPLLVNEVSVNQVLANFSQHVAGLDECHRNQTIRLNAHVSVLVLSNFLSTIQELVVRCVD